MIRTYDDFGYSMDPVELYDMAADPYQTRNLRDSDPEVVNQCENLLKEWVDKQLTAPDAIPDPFEAVLQERREGKPLY